MNYITGVLVKQLPNLRTLLPIMLYLKTELITFADQQVYSTYSVYVRISVKLEKALNNKRRFSHQAQAASGQRQHFYNILPHRYMLIEQEGGFQ